MSKPVYAYEFEIEEILRRHGIGVEPSERPTPSGIIDEIIADVKEANFAARICFEFPK